MQIKLECSILLAFQLMLTFYTRMLANANASISALSFIKKITQGSQSKRKWVREGNQTSFL